MLDNIEQIAQEYITARSAYEAGQMNVSYRVSSYTEHSYFYQGLIMYKHFKTILNGIIVNGEINMSFDFDSFLNNILYFDTPDHIKFCIYITQFLSMECCGAFLKNYTRKDKFYLNLLKRMVFLLEASIVPKDVVSIE